MLSKIRCNFFIRESELGKILYVDCSGCKNNSSVSNRNCFSLLSTIILKENVDKVIFLRENFKRVLEEKEVRKLKKYLRAIGALEPDAFCKRCRQKVIFMKRNFKNPSLVLENIRKIGKCESCSRKIKHVERAINSAFPGINTPESVERSLSRIRDKVVPTFFKYFVEDGSKGKGKVISSYEIPGGKVSIVKRESELVYHLLPEELFLSTKEIKLLEKIFEREKSASSREENLRNVGERVSNIFKRYSSGYGLIETLLKDEKIQDVFINSPGNSRIFVNHSDFGFCSTNLVISQEEVKRICTKLRMLSGRAFDAASPVLDCFIPELNTRVCGITKPLAFDGIGLSLRKHKTLPWTLTQFVKNGMVSSYAAGLLSFLVDSQASILITGCRGSGKTSLLASLLAEIRPNERIVIIEDTPELPVAQLRESGFNVEHLRVRSPTTENTFESPPEIAVRTSLRLGEGILVVGEVRGVEAKALFEAMRVGAAGSCVLGTIHGFSAYDTFDRIVNDLQVPRTSFKACDIVVSCALLKNKQGVKKQRRVIEITEIRKDWNVDPIREKGFLQLMEFSQRKSSLVLRKLSESQVLRKICLLRGMSFNEVLKAIELREKVKRMIVKFSEKRQYLLNFRSTLRLNRIFYDLEGSLSSYEVLRKFKKVLENNVTFKNF